ncbi:hypothetical protein QJS04_geneDACA019668 [Acorus gramineus]|uniref:Uncharacterized protein n=1 Tax=Acorus gramineus TaxID=55184 RepID=A0AAV9BPL1_ACOGR|nr:hypothetical protein QJS04_geneDACA019668 [Acorus gramineus]
MPHLFSDWTTAEEALYNRGKESLRYSKVELVPFSVLFFGLPFFPNFPPSNVEMTHLL